MKNSSEIKSTLAEMMEKRYHAPTSFEDFCAAIMEMGIVRLHFDALIVGS